MTFISQIIIGDEKKSLFLDACCCHLWVEGGFDLRDAKFSHLIKCAHTQKKEVNNVLHEQRLDCKACAY